MVDMTEQEKNWQFNFICHERWAVNAVCSEVIAALARYSIKNKLNEDHPVEQKLREIAYARDVKLRKAKSYDDLNKIIAQAHEAQDWLASLPGGSEMK